MPSFTDDPVVSTTNLTNAISVVGESAVNEGVRGISHNAHSGVVGINDFSPMGPAGAGGNGGWFESTQGEGVRGWSKTPYHGGVVGTNSAGGFGVYGQSDDGIGVVGESKNSEGVRGTSHSGHGGVVGVNDGGGNGGWFESTQGEGVRGTSHSAHGGVVGINDAGGPAGFFQGDVVVTGDVLLQGADCAEQFEVSGLEEVEPGTVMVISREGGLQVSKRPYDRNVAGVVSGAGDLRPGIVLDQQSSPLKRATIGLVGKVYCKVDASCSPIEIGDLLTTSPTLGHAMKAMDPLKAFGAVIGKALRPLETGYGLIPILIALQ